MNDNEPIQPASELKTSNASPLFVNDVVPKTTCRACNTEVSDSEAYCINCGFPLTGAEYEQDEYINNKNYMEMDLVTMKKKVSSAAKTLYVLSGLSLLSSLIVYNTVDDTSSPGAITIVYLILTIIYAGLALWTKKQALTAIISGLILFVIVQVLSIVEDPANVYKGIIFKVIIIVYLVKGIRSATEAQRIKKQWNLQ